MRKHMTIWQSSQHTVLHNGAKRAYDSMFQRRVQCDFGPRVHGQGILHASAALV